MVLLPKAQSRARFSVCTVCLDLLLDFGLCFGLLWFCHLWTLQNLWMGFRRSINSLNLNENNTFKGRSIASVSSSKSSGTHPPPPRQKDKSTYLYLLPKMISNTMVIAIICVYIYNIMIYIYISVAQVSLQNPWAIGP